MTDAGPDAVHPDDVRASDHSDVPADVDGAYLFGINRDGAPFYYDDDQRRVVEGDRHGGVAEDYGVVDDIEALVDDIEERIGWDILGDED